MIKIEDESFLKTAKRVKVLVIPVNCSGSVEHGIIRKFKLNFPETFNFYLNACNEGKIKKGEVSIFKNIDSEKLPDFICCFSTKEECGDESSIETLEQGLDALVSTLNEKDELDSCAIPALGYSKEKLQWEEIESLIIKKMSLTKNKKIIICPPRV